MPRGIPNKPRNATPEPDDAAPEPQTMQDDAPPVERLPLNAAPARRRVAPIDQKLPIVASVVFVIVSTGQKGKIDILPLHEVPLLRRKIHLQEPAAETPKVLAEYPGNLDRIRGKTAIELRDEYQRLLDRYKFDKPNGREGEEINLVADFYGNGLSQLRSTMRRLEDGWRQIVSELGEDEVPSDEQMEELVMLADPDFDLEGSIGGEIEYQSFEPAGRGAVVPTL